MDSGNSECSGRYVVEESIEEDCPVSLDRIRRRLVFLQNQSFIQTGSVVAIRLHKWKNILYYISRGPLGAINRFCWCEKQKGEGENYYRKGSHPLLIRLYIPGCSSSGSPCIWYVHISYMMMLHI